MIGLKNFILLFSMLWVHPHTWTATSNLALTKLDQAVNELQQSGPNTTVDSIAFWIDEVKTYGISNAVAQSCFVNLLKENHQIYQQRGSQEIINLRGYIFAAFETISTPTTAEAFIVAALSYGKHPYLIAGASKAIRGLDKNTTAMLPYLMHCLHQSFYDDDELSFEAFYPDWPLANPSSAGLEIVKTLEWMGEQAYGVQRELESIKADMDQQKLIIPANLENAISKLLISMQGKLPPCCQKTINEAYQALLNQPIFIEPIDRLAPKFVDFKFQDQAGQRLSFESFFDQPTVVVFFYSRCDNPNKCSMTVSKFAQLQTAIHKAGIDKAIRMAAISYDPDFDTPQKLKQYGENRGLQFDDQLKALRSIDDFKLLQDHFQLQAAYQANLVSFHSVELFLLDQQGRISYRYPRTGWSEDLIIQQLELMINE